jgi:hypothetical protein
MIVEQNHGENVGVFEIMATLADIQAATKIA